MDKDQFKIFSFFTSFVSVVMMLFAVGFYDERLHTLKIMYYYDFNFSVTFINILYYTFWKRINIRNRYLFELFVLLSVVLYFFSRHEYLFSTESDFYFIRRWYLFFLIVLVFFRDLLNIKLDFKRTTISPATLFIISFILVILLGTAFLLMPKATVNGIEPTDALFTATSAVCITGLTVLDISKDFTFLGQVIIISLVQIGGLGMMTFVSYFGYFFRGVSSYENQLLIGQMISSDKLSDVFSTLRRIIIITFTIELVGALFLFLTLDLDLFDQSTYQAVYFSIFHSISGFCNAGYSTLSEGFHHFNYQYNYGLHFVLAILIILGGLGFPIVYNIYLYFRYTLQNYSLRWLTGRSISHSPWILSLSSRIILITTVFLLFFGTVFFYFMEKDNAFAHHSGIGKIIQAFFMSSAFRTAGFSTIDITTLAPISILFSLFLMWIGASPASTAGGIKTTTITIAFLNVISLVRGKNRLEIYRREISEGSIRRSYAIIFLSLIVMGCGLILLISFEGNKDLLSIIFEVFSAYSTTGLSLNTTPELSSGGKIVIITLMFLGRISTLTLLIALIRQEKYFNYKYPKEDIIIN